MPETTIKNTSNSDVVRSMIAVQDDELARLSIAPPATENSPTTMTTTTLEMNLSGIGSISEAVSASRRTNEADSTSKAESDALFLRQAIVTQFNNDVDSDYGSYQPRNVVATGFVGNDDASNLYDFDTGSGEWDYENLELNFDDLYSDSNAEEEYFVQQASPLVAQYARELTSTETSTSTMGMMMQQTVKSEYSTPPAISATSSYCGASCNTNYDADVDDRNEDFDVDDNDYYQLTAALSRSSFSAADTVGVDDEMMMYNKKAAFMNENDSTTEKVPTKPKLSHEANPTASAHYPDETYILGTLIIRVVAARGLPSVNDYYSNAKIHSGGSNNRNTNLRSNSNVRYRDKKKRPGGFFRMNQEDGYDDDDVGTNPYVSVRFTTLVENIEDDVNNPVVSRKQPKFKRQLLNQQVQRTSTIHNSCQPVWPRGENIYMDVSHPTPIQPLRNREISEKSSKTSDIGGGFINQISKTKTSETNIDDIHKTASSSSVQSIRCNTDSNSGYKKSHAASLDTKDPFIRTLRNKYGTGKSTEDTSLQASSDGRRRSILSPILSCAVFHAPTHGSTKGKIFDDCSISKQKQKNKNNDIGDSDDLFLGMASFDVTPLLTGKISMIDEWLTLSGGLAESGHSLQDRSAKNHSKNRIRSMIRIICEYEPTDTIPQKGDYVQFTKFCHPADLYPLMATSHSLYKVEEVFDQDSPNDDDDYVLISTISSGSHFSLPEGRSVNDYWKSTFLVHRCMLILCKEREPTVLEVCRHEIMNVAERIAVSPLVSVVNETVHVRVPEDGLLNVGKTAVHQAVSILFTRWFQNDNGVQTFLQDITYATNWDGQNSTLTTSRASSSSENGGTGRLPNNSVVSISHQNSNDLEKDYFIRRSGALDDEEKVQNSSPTSRFQSVILPNMPPCPITGVPMNDPVVAADGHTYEREAIARWLQSNDRSPLTGAVLTHKNLVPNYMLLSSLQDLAKIPGAQTDEELFVDPLNSIVPVARLKESSLGLEERPAEARSTSNDEEMHIRNSEIHSPRESDDSEKYTAEININDN